MKSEGKVWVLYDAYNNKKSRPLSLVQAQILLLTLKVKTLHHHFIWTPGWSDWQALPDFLASDQKYFSGAQPPEPLLAKERLKDTKPLQKAKTSRANAEEITRSISKTLRVNDIQDEATPSLIYTKVVAEEAPQRIDYGYYYNEFCGDDLSLSGLPQQPPMDIILSRASLGSPLERRRAPRHDLKIEVILLTKRGTSFRTYSKNISISGTLLEDDIPRDFFHRPFEMILINKFEKDARKNRVHLTGKIIGDFEDPRRLLFADPDLNTKLKLQKLIQDYQKDQQKYRKPAV